ncbi:glycine zipper domain-containing protein [Sphingomonas bacterium]|uniref:glycine zipper domain-containing protein n=1 Tax=Sphingomonas bacterium TaxID=1895847 RepID=UPI0015759CE8|nr:glycine zipper domain-containing protein [Sphingomonas bacterium]
MKNKIAAALLVAVVATPVALPTAAVAQQWHGDQDGNWDPAPRYRDKNYGRPLNENDRVYRGSDGRTYCKRSNGTTGLVLGAVGGGLIGNALGGGTLGTLLGAGGGALLGKNLDQKHEDSQNRKNGYYCR